MNTICICVFELTDNKYYITEYDSSDSFTTLNLGLSLQNIDWIKKYPIKTILGDKFTCDIDSISIQYMIKYGIDNVRSDYYTDVILKDNILKIINSKIKALKPSNTDSEINKYKKLYKNIKDNNLIIEKFTNYRINLNNIHISRIDNNYSAIMENISNASINVLIPNFINTFSEEIKSILEKYFCNWKLMEEIYQAVLLKKKTDKIISTYGNLDVINKKIVELYQIKIDLLYVNNNQVNNNQVNTHLFFDECYTSEDDTYEEDSSEHESDDEFSELRSVK